MITEQEAREAEKRRLIVSIGNGDDSVEAQKLAAIVLEELARREAERIERAKPIDAEWCVANGAVMVDGCSMFRWTLKVVRVDWDEHNGTTIDESDCCWVFLPSIKTRGQLLDLLAALKGGAT